MNVIMSPKPVFTVAGDHILHLMDVLSNRGF